jgi:hypothetical protein
VNFSADGLAGGIYFYRLDDGSKVRVNNMIITR